ncbi:beta-propeller fold lactonase family protein [Oculatella sp. LEGE 06141]|uniref:YVTN family beta-propeller repeat protein n=1 Tax=Oculatella sp. LEGE 06141 TaxID=1828648 RepID=UPI001881CA7E|nr:beta-propeller fold lactonase family protein [Oculatella sp. LEGE 06141]MBE9179305.1 beta-propeller fold lactonase family protein [Oculatella sp. LEGE 06141]
MDSILTKVNVPGYRIDNADVHSPMFIAISLMPNGRRPGLPAFTPDHRYLLIPNEESDNVSILSLAKLSIIHTVELQAGSRPWQAKVLPSGQFAYVTNSRFQNTATASPRENSTVSLIDMNIGEVVKEIVVGAGPNGVTVDRKGQKGYVMNMRSNTVSVIDASAHEVVETLQVGDAPAFGKLTHDGKLLVVTNLGSSSLSLVDTDRMEVIQTVEVGIPKLNDSYPEWGEGDTTGVAISSENIAYVTNWRSHTIVILDLKTGCTTKFDSPIKHPFGVEIDSVVGVVVFTSGVEKAFAVFDIHDGKWLGVFPNNGTVFPGLESRMTTLNLWMTDPDNNRLTALLPRGLKGISEDWNRNMVTKFM